MSVPRYWRMIPYLHRLVASYCENCSKYYYPPREICPRCRNKDLKNVDINGEGKLLTFTVIRSPPADFESLSPYIMGLVEVDGKIRVIARIVDVEPEELRIGMSLEPTVRRYRVNGKDGIIQYGIAFRPPL